MGSLKKNRKKRPRRNKGIATTEFPNQTRATHGSQAKVINGKTDRSILIAVP
jgi:hypothetical protein